MDYCQIPDDACQFVRKAFAALDKNEPIPQPSSDHELAQPSIGAGVSFNARVNGKRIRRVAVVDPRDSRPRWEWIALMVRQYKERAGKEVAIHSTDGFFRVTSYCLASVMLTDADPEALGLVVTSNSHFPRTGVSLPNIRDIKSVQQQLAYAMQDGGIPRFSPRQISLVEVHRTSEAPECNKPWGMTRADRVVRQQGLVLSIGKALMAVLAGERIDSLPELASEIDQQLVGLGVTFASRSRHACWVSYDLTESGLRQLFEMSAQHAAKSGITPSASRVIFSLLAHPDIFRENQQNRIRLAGESLRLLDAPRQNTILSHYRQYHSWSDKEFVAAVRRKAQVEPGEGTLQRLATESYEIRDHSVVQFPSRSIPNGKLLPAAIEERLSGTAQFLLNIADGPLGLPYAIDPCSSRTVTAGTVTRIALAGWALVEAGDWLGTQRFVKLGARVLIACLDCVSIDGRSIVSTLDQYSANLGTAAILLSAISAKTISGDHRKLRPMAELLASCFLSDGAFCSRQIGLKMGVDHTILPACALLGILNYQSVTGELLLTERIVSNALTRYTKIANFRSDWGAISWLPQAVAMANRTGVGEISWDGIKSLVDYAVGMQIGSGAYLSTMDHDTSGFGTACAIEGIATAAAISTAWSTEVRENYLSSALNAFGFLDRIRLGSDDRPFLSEKHQWAGAIVRDEWNYEVRVDYSAHYMLAAVRILRGLHCI